jgi:hypothetical protein
VLIKRPIFEEVKCIRVFRNPDDLKEVGASFSGHMLVGVEYRGHEVRLVVKERLQKGEYKGQILSFSPGGETYEDLNVGEEVVFRALNISWIFR